MNQDTAQPSANTAVIREATLQDIQQWDQLKLGDFAGDFSRVELPIDRPATKGEMSRAVDQFLDGLKH